MYKSPHAQMKSISNFNSVYYIKVNYDGVPG